MTVETQAMNMRGGKTSKVSLPHIYECKGCGHRVNDDRQPIECPRCESWMQNISKPRE